MLEALDRYYGDHKYILHNSFIFGHWEMDWFGMNRREYVYEVEVKLSASDYKADFKKKEKHERFMAADKEVVLVQCGTFTKYSHDAKKEVELCHFYYEKQHTANRFFYACPTGLLQPEEMPPYAGLLYIDKDGEVIKVKEAPMIHKRKPDLRGVLLDKFYWRYQELRKKIENN